MKKLPLEVEIARKTAVPSDEGGPCYGLLSYQTMGA